MAQLKQLLLSLTGFQSEIMAHCEQYRRVTIHVTNNFFKTFIEFRSNQMRRKGKGKRWRRCRFGDAHDGRCWKLMDDGGACGDGEEIS